MPSVSSPAKVLVTGANGFVAAWVVHSLLEAGYSVRGTVRSADKGEHIKSLFSSYGGNFEYVVVDDITKDGAFDEAVKGVDLVEHTASPFHYKAKEPEELIAPAVHGTVGILESVKKHGLTVKRVVITSSTAAVLKPADKGETYDETSWDDPAIKEVKEKGAEAHPSIMYLASKTLAEKAAWEFFENNKDTINWDLVVLNPPYVFGPTHDVHSSEDLGTSMRSLYDVILGTKDAPELATGSTWIDVRDLGAAHVLAGERQTAGGERIIVSAGPFYWQEMLDIANTIKPAPLSTLMKGRPGSTIGKAPPLDFDTHKADKVLGLKYRSLKTMLADTLEEFAGYRGTK